MTLTATDQLTELMDDAITAKRQYKAALDAGAAWKEQHRMPTLPRQFESLEDYQRERARLNRWSEERKAIETVTKEAWGRVEEIKRKLLQIVPLETWFRHGDYGVGISYSNWGGHKTSLEVHLWRDQMPTLDHRYYGD